MLTIDKYEAVIGLEVHAQLLTKSKLFCSDAAQFSDNPNSQVSPISLGHPGTLPKLNERVIEFAIMLGLACNSKITKVNYFDRKHYFYPDLPKGYQVTQFATPICVGGTIEIQVEGQKKQVKLDHIHLEEDAGRSIHDQHDTSTLVDLNRAGVPLLEIVTEPDMHSPEEAFAYLTEIRKLVRYLEICDGNMEQGSLRCDANISVREKGQVKLGAKVEIKNMNSIRNVKRAIAFEIQRQIKEIESGATIDQCTRSFEATSGKTFPMRSKEEAHDYRYFPEPDLSPFIISADAIDKAKINMPALPNEILKRLMLDYQLSEYDAGVLTDEKPLVLYFEELVANAIKFKTAANWVMGTVKSFLNEHHISIEKFPLRAKILAALIKLVETEKVSHTAASQQIFPMLIKKLDIDPETLAKEMNLIQESDNVVIRECAEQVINGMPEKVQAYKKGKKGLIGLFMGEVMKKSNGKIDPKSAKKILIDILDK